MVKHPSCKRLRYLMKDEKHAKKVYHGYGYNELSSDEGSHWTFLFKIYKKKCKG